MQGFEREGILMERRCDRWGFLTVVGGKMMETLF